MISDCLELFGFLCKQRGQWRPRLQNLVQLNTPHAVEDQSREAFKQMVLKGEKGIESAIHSLAKLKGVGPATASGDLKTQRRYSGFKMLNSKMEAEIFRKICCERIAQSNSPKSRYNLLIATAHPFCFLTAMISPPFKIPVRVLFLFTSFRFFSPTCENKRAKVSDSIL